MNHYPHFESFARFAESQLLVPVYRQLVSDTLTPLTAWCKIREQGHSFLFESVIGGEKVGRYSFVGTRPFLSLSARGNQVTLRTDTLVREETAEDPLRDLEALLAKYRAVHVPGLPRFCGGAVGYAGYDIVRYSEDLPNVPEDDRELPDLSFAFYDSMIIFDHIQKTVQVVALADGSRDDLRAAYEEACNRVDELCEQLASSEHNLQLTDIDLNQEIDLDWKSNFTQQEFESAVERCKEYIQAGDIFQVVFSQRLELETTARPLDIYRTLRVVNPSPFMFLLELPETTLVGSSPEIMVRVEEGKTTIRPLAGTRRRGVTEEEDQRLAEELLADPKERAEHVMLIDLARNDVGRVSQFDTVELSDVMVVERYSHVMHITSNVTGQLLPGRTALDALRAGLPAGTVSGAPKIRAMEIIDEIEPHKRGPYAGAVGYFDFTGNMDTCIALRTLVMRDGKAWVQVGAGIVADSVPALEYEETLNKARGLLKAISIAESQIQAARTR
ncbi:MAG TPA: anthranilate synthase component I [Planctomycetaceae bacterium]|nr:anthranilate synthase component I [Planctomycetaceae bacterium]